MNYVLVGGGCVAVATIAFAASCASTQAPLGAADEVSGRRSSSELVRQVTLEQGVRIDAIQRHEAQAGDAVTGVVLVRNTSSSPRTVSVGVTWLGGDGGSLSKGGSSSETVTLAPRESRELVFHGAEGSRDFKVALSSAAQ